MGTIYEGSKIYFVSWIYYAIDIVLVLALLLTLCIIFKGVLGICCGKSQKSIDESERSDTPLSHYDEEKLTHEEGERTEAE